MLSKRWTWLTAFALLFAGVTNAHSHIHYCFDGRAPSAAVFHVDGSDHAHAIPAHHAHDLVHADDDHGADHDDLDLDVPNDAIAKTVKHDAPAIVAALLWTAEPSPAVGAACSSTGSAAPAPDPPHTRPQSRAPPR
jgi:hypothetical protein